MVMTTEVLRNMLYAGSSTLTGLGFVVMDEVHYLADRFRGAVWEEVIIHLPESVALVSLSATVSNAEEFGEWLETVRGETDHDRRGAPAGAALPARDGRPEDLRPVQGRRLRRTAQVNPDLMRIARDDWRVAPGPATTARKRNAPRGRAGARGQGPAAAVRCPAATTSSSGSTRAGPAAGDHLRVQPGRLRRRRHPVPERQPQAHLPRGARGDPAVRRETAAATSPTRTCTSSATTTSSTGLTRGVAAHHAGMLPTFKECVEELFTNGLCRVVFATETLALGINMPARSVVIEKLSKWNGETHADITPGEYTQLTGRAGRRGIDVEGHGVVLWQQGFDPKAVAGLASTRTYPLKSSFRPSYNMAVNLVHQVGRADRARAARVVVRAVPGRQGGRRAGPAAAQGRGGAARGTPRRRPATSATSWSTPGCAAGSPTWRAPRPRASGPTTADQVRRVAGGAAPRRRDRGAGREVLRDGRGGRPGDALGPGRPPALRADRRPATRAGSRWSTSRCRSRRSPGCGSRRRSTAATPSPGATWPRRCGPAPRASRRPRRVRPRAAAVARRARRPTASGRSPGCAPSCARTPATAARTARTTPAGPSGTTSSSGTPGPCSGASSSAPTRSPGSSTGSATC